MASEKEAFIAEVAQYANKYMKTTKVPASLTIAQAILESNWGKSGLARQNKNLFGIKGKGESYQTKEFIGGKWMTVTANFRTYDTFEGSVRDHNEMLKRLKRYKAVLGERDYKQACVAVWKAGYATDPDYPKKLMAIIEAFELWKYDDWGDALNRADADAIIRILQDKWANATSVEERKECNRLANVLRKLSGQPIQ